MSAQGRDDAGRGEKSSLAAHSKQIEDGLRAPVPGARLGSSQSGEPSAPRAQRAHRRGQRGTAGAARGCGDFGSLPRSTNLLITLTKEQSPGTGLACCTFLLLRRVCVGGNPSLYVKTLPNPPLAFGGGGTPARTQGHTRSPSSSTHRRTSGPYAPGWCQRTGILEAMQER